MGTHHEQPQGAVVNVSVCDVGFKDNYKGIHTYLALCICCVGTITNILNMVILTRREMINSTNSILTGLAVSDFLLLLEYLIYVSTYLRGDEHLWESYWHSVFVLFHAHFSQITHTISICLTVTLAVWRYIAICKPHLNLILCTLPRARCAVIMAYIISPIICVPNYFMYSIHQFPESSSNTSLYQVKLSSYSDMEVFQKIHFWLHSVVVKILPCILLTVLIFNIIRAMYVAKRRKVNLIKMGTPSMESVERKIPRMEKLTQKTTKMLLTVLFMFLITELPQGILVLITAIYGHSFLEDCYNQWGEVMDLLALINATVNFLLYCIMSHQFRFTFKHLCQPPKQQNLSPKWGPDTGSAQAATSGKPSQD
ncbi:unnamed protein product, partial [Meganyctiphanes norvegica]